MAADVRARAARRQGSGTVAPYRAPLLDDRATRLSPSTTRPRAARAAPLPDAGTGTVSHVQPRGPCAAGAGTATLAGVGVEADADGAGRGAGVAETGVGSGGNGEGSRITGVARLKGASTRRAPECQLVDARSTPRQVSLSMYGRTQVPNWFGQLG